MNSGIKYFITVAVALADLTVVVLTASPLVTEERETNELIKLVPEMIEQYTALYEEPVESRAEVLAGYLSNEIDYVEAAQEIDELFLDTGGPITGATLVSRDGNYFVFNLLKDDGTVVYPRLGVFASLDSETRKVAGIHIGRLVPFSKYDKEYGEFLNTPLTREVSD